MLFQKGDPTVAGWRNYYTGWMHALLPATSNVEKCALLSPMFSAYNGWMKVASLKRVSHSRLVTAESLLTSSVP